MGRPAYPEPSNVVSPTKLQSTTEEFPPAKGSGRLLAEAVDQLPVFWTEDCWKLQFNGTCDLGRWNEERLESVSKLFEEDEEAGQLHKAKEVLCPSAAER
jgi:hypothetical protein